MSAIARNSLVRVIERVPAPLAARFGSTGLASRIVRPFMNRLVLPGPTPLSILSGPAEGIVLLADPRSEKYYWTGTYERTVQNSLVQLLGPGQTFWDVGAHIGFLTLLASRLVGPAGRVEAFEPLPDNRVRLEAALTMNKSANVSVHDCALAAERRTRKLYAHKASNMWTLVPEFAGSEDGSINVDCRTLDDLARALGPPDLIKIDVEGAEMETLRGGHELLTGHKPTLLVEFSDRATLMAGQDALRGYAFSRLGDRQWLLTPT